MSDPHERLVTARTAYRDRRWPEAYAGFVEVGRRGALDAEDLAALASSAWWLGRADEAVAAAEAAALAYDREGRSRPAARAVLEVAVMHHLRGDATAGGEWIGRAAQLLAPEPEGAEHGYLTYLVHVEAGLEGADLEAVAASLARIGDLGRRHGDPALVGLGLLGEGRVRLRQGDVHRGSTLLDEAMAQVAAGDVAPHWACTMYDHVVTAYRELADPGRTRFWVEAMSRWLETVPAAALFGGIHRLHRAHVLRAMGRWDASEREALRGCADLADIASRRAAEGHYQLGELARLRGDLPAAERSYELAHELGHDPQPGFALLCLAQGQTDTAVASIRAALIPQTTNRLGRARLLTPHAEIAVATGDVVAAGDTVAELAGISEAYASPGFTAAARHWHGAVLLAEGRVAEALPWLSAAIDDWQELETPYDAARARVLLGQAYRAQGDIDSAELEFTAAAEVFGRLGAAHDTSALATARDLPTGREGLTDR